jgi:hypothetical protein
MQKVIVIYNGASQVCPLLSEQTAESIAASYGVTDPALYKEFAESDFDTACYGWSNAFTLTNGVVSFDLNKAKQLAEAIVNLQSNEKAKEILAGLSYDVYIAQCSLPKEQRIAKYQAAINANNALAIETENREQAIYAASTIQEVNAIVYPPKD